MGAELKAQCIKFFQVGGDDVICNNTQVVSLSGQQSQASST